LTIATHDTPFSRDEATPGGACAASGREKTSYFRVMSDQQLAALFRGQIGPRIMGR
jgi:hypothetical protein